jgi:5-methylthioadenosine/S-adenosylhomocysteine deaminase
MATVNGARAIGLEGELGEIREGALADMILVRLDEPQFIPANNVIAGLVYSSSGAEVDTVMVDGRVLMTNRRLTTIDEAGVYREIRRITERLGMTSARRV